MRTMQNHIEHWDDERDIGNGVIVMLKYGWAFEPTGGEHARGFDTVAEARHATAKKRLFACKCEECAPKPGRDIAGTFSGQTGQK